MYIIIDTKTNKQIGGTYKTRIKADERADKLDMQYGAVRYSVRFVG